MVTIVTASPGTISAMVPRTIPPFLNCTISGGSAAGCGPAGAGAGGASNAAVAALGSALAALDHPHSVTNTPKNTELFTPAVLDIGLIASVPAGQ